MSFGQFAEVLTIARKVDNWEEDATGATALWPTDKLYKAEVPAGKRWFFFGGIVNRDVPSTVTAYIRDSANENIRILDDFSSASGMSSYPSNSEGGINPQMCGFIIMDPGDYVALVFGTSQTAAAYASAQVLEIPYP